MCSSLCKALIVKPSSSFIMSGLDNFPVSVFLHEFSVAFIVKIRPFEAFAFTVFLDGRSVAFALFECSFILASVGIVYYYLSVGFSVFERSVKHVAAFLCELSMPEP